MHSAAVIVSQAETLTLCVDLLANDLEYYAEANVLTPELRNGALVLFARLRQTIDDFARTLPPMMPPKKPYSGPRTPTHYRQIADAESKVLMNGKRRR
jgi:hypothetical protein